MTIIGAEVWLGVYAVGASPLPRIQSDVPVRPIIWIGGIEFIVFGHYACRQSAKTPL